MKVITRRTMILSLGVPSPLFPRRLSLAAPISNVSRWTPCRTCLAWIIECFLLPAVAPADEPPLAGYLRQRVAACAAGDAIELASAAEWPARRDAMRAQLQSMLGLSPWPSRGDLMATRTGTVERDGVVVEKLHFQSSPGLYVTANFYRPKQAGAPLPAILYLCGHSRVVEGGVSFGNKVAYQHHGAWFARNGYCCLSIDTLQLGEIEGIHHGTYREGMWWWIARGYTPAGVEAWNAIRALDYLETRPEVDRKRIGVTGRSGGGAYSWWVAALDDRPACFAPVAGITDLSNHILDGCIDGHCDCMYMVNRRGWDFGRVACLVAPRPCLLLNSDKDSIFPLDGVVRVHARMRRLYETLGAGDKLGLAIGEGPHKDTQELQVAAFHWLNRWLRKDDRPIAWTAEKLFTQAELKVFDQLPADSINASIHETFVPMASSVDPPGDLTQWSALRKDWLAHLRETCFAAWPKGDVSLDIEATEGEGARRTIHFTSEPGIRLSLQLAGSKEAAEPIVLHIVGEDGATFLDRTLVQTPVGQTWAFLVPRGCGETWRKMDTKARTQMLRRFALTGQTMDEGRVWDIRQGLAALRESGGAKRPVILAGKGIGAGLALYASLFEDDVSELDLQNPPTSHREGPIFMSVLRVLDMPQALALALPRKVRIHGGNPDRWNWARQVSFLFASEDTLPMLEFVP